MNGYNDQQIIQLIPQYSINSTCYAVKCSMATAPQSPVIMVAVKDASADIPTKKSEILSQLNAAPNDFDVLCTVGALKDTVDRGENVNRKDI